ncbi:MAG: M23 family metallopeptidase [Fibromonadaceae bacterium]|nr:M23 family metallopeptidase [Fibromonadaceae bacterium]
MKLFVWLVSLFAILLCIFIWKFAEINVQLASYWRLKTDNEWLLKRHTEYEQVFTELDSIYIIERQIQNILSTYFEDDTNKVRSVLDRNRLHIALKNIHQDTDSEPEINLTRQNLDVFPNMLPVIGGVISRGYSEAHKAVDFVVSIDGSVYATASGRVVFAGEKSGLGLVLEIDHGGGFVTRYGHLARYSVRTGNHVRKGEIIGTVGSTGTSSTHLHYEILLNSKPVNPERYF